LPNAQVDALDNLRNLSDKHAAKKITEAAIQMFCDDFEQVEQATEDHDEEIDRADSAVEAEQAGVTGVDEQASKEHGEQAQGRRTMFRPYFQRTTAEVRVLLS
jgi:conserved oligomeric Golgi complex subunit 6